MTVFFVARDLFWAGPGNISENVTNDATLTTAGQTHGAHWVNEQCIADITFPSAEEIFTVDNNIVAVSRNYCTIIILVITYTLTLVKRFRQRELHLQIVCVNELCFRRIFVVPGAGVGAHLIK